MYALVGVALVVLFTVKRVYILVKGLTSRDERIPRVVTTIRPDSIPGFFLPRTRFHRGLHFFWDEKHITYKNSDFNTVFIVPVLFGPAVLYTSNLSVFRQVLASNAPFAKPDMTGVDVMGSNVLTTDGHHWRRHRRIVAPAFNHTTYRNVWDVTTKVYEDMLKQEGWLRVDETAPTNFNKITHKLALFLVAIVGFGWPMSWSEPRRDDKGRLSLQSVAFEIATTPMERCMLPRWSYYLGFQKLKDIDEAFTAFEHFMHERIAERETQLRELRAMDGSNDSEIADSIKDIFGRLVNARISDGKLSLSDEEIIGNCFIFTFAGHESTANTLSTALAQLALNPDKQEWAYNSIRSAIGDRLPTFEDFDALTGILACFYEALRMYTPAYLSRRTATTDVTIDIPHRDKPEVIERLVVKEGTSVIMDYVGMFYDPRTFPDPESYKPERWVRSRKPVSSSQSPITKDTDAGEVSGSLPATTLGGFVGFSVGPRTCIGHKFSKVEAVAFLTLLLREWRVEPVFKEGETKEEWKARVLKPSLKVTLTVDEVPLKLIRRK